MVTLLSWISTGKLRSINSSKPIGFPVADMSAVIVSGLGCVDYVDDVAFWAGTGGDLSPRVACLYPRTPIDPGVFLPGTQSASGTSARFSIETTFQKDVRKVYCQSP